MKVSIQYTILNPFPEGSFDCAVYLLEKGSISSILSPGRNFLTTCWMTETEDPVGAAEYVCVWALMASSEERKVACRTATMPFSPGRHPTGAVTGRYEESLVDE